MRGRPCPRAAGITEVARTGGDLVPYREHMEGCEACWEAVTVTTWLGEVAVETSRAVSVPSAESIWWRSQVVRRLCDQDDRESRKAKPLAWIQIGGVTLAAVTVVALFLGDNLVSSGLVEGLTALLGGSGAAVLAIAALASLATGALVAWQAFQEIG